MAKTALITKDLAGSQEYAGDTGPALCRQGLLSVKRHATPIPSPQASAPADGVIEHQSEKAGVRLAYRLGAHLMLIAAIIRRR
jgi:hypothetical protein